MPDYWPSPRSLPYGESGKMAQNGTNSFHIGAFESAWLYGPFDRPKNAARSGLAAENAEISDLR